MSDGRCGMTSRRTVRGDLPSSCLHCTLLHGSFVAFDRSRLMPHWLNKCEEKVLYFCNDCKLRVWFWRQSLRIEIDALRLWCGVLTAATFTATCFWRFMALFLTARCCDSSLAPSSTVTALVSTIWSANHRSRSPRQRAGQIKSQKRGA